MLTVMVVAAVGLAASWCGPDVDRYSVTYLTPSTSSLGAMPVGNGRTSANVWVDAATGDVVLNLGLADAFDENSNLLKLGRVRITLDPPLLPPMLASSPPPSPPPSLHGSSTVAVGFNQTLVLSVATIVISTPVAEVSVWVDANTSTVRVRVAPNHNTNPGTTNTGSRSSDDGNTGGKANLVSVTATLDHQQRLNSTLDAGLFGNGWGGAGGSFCYSNGSVADYVGIYPDKLYNYHAPSPTRAIPQARTARRRAAAALQDAAPPPGAVVAWYHRNNVGMSDFYGDTMKEQGLDGCGPSCWDPITNRSFGAALVGGASFGSSSSSSSSKSGRVVGGQLPFIRTSKPSAEPVDIAIAVTSAQTFTVGEFEARMDATILQAHSELSVARVATQRAMHTAWWGSFYNRSYFHVTVAEPAPPVVDGYAEHSSTVGDQSRMMWNASWPLNGKSPGNCEGHVDAPFIARQGRATASSTAASDPACIARCAAMCNAIKGCVSFALSSSWHGGKYPQLYTDGLSGATSNSDWTYYVNTSAPSPSPAPSPPPSPPQVPAGFLISRQNVLMRYMDVCSSSRIGGGVDSNQYFALKYNGGILTSEASPKDDYRAWGPGQWWQNLRLPYYAMLAEGGADLFKPLLRWYLELLPLALRRTEIWFNKTDSAGRDLRRKNVHGAFFMETATQFGTYVPSEKGYHCPTIRNASWTTDWAGNEAINLHREGSVELLMLALDYYDHTLDNGEFALSILPLSIAVTDFVASYYDANTTTGKLEIWPTQALEGYRPGSFPPTRDNTVSNDMPWVAGLTAVVPRLLKAASAYNADVAAADLRGCNAGSEAAGGAKCRAGAGAGASNGAAGLVPVPQAQVAKWQALLSILPDLPTRTVANDGGGDTVLFAAAQTPYPPHAILGGSEQPELYAVHPYRLSSVMRGGPLLNVGIATVGPNPDYGTGWKQGVMQVALLGMADKAAEAVIQRASTLNADMRFPAYLPSMQDFRPNEDHLSNMRSALQYMLVQHSDANATVGMFPAWPCDAWSASFKLHLPAQTIVEGEYSHVTKTATLKVTPKSREPDVVMMSCAGKVVFL